MEGKHDHIHEHEHEHAHTHTDLMPMGTPTMGLCTVTDTLTSTATAMSISTLTRILTRAIWTNTSTRKNTVRTVICTNRRNWSMTNIPTRPRADAGRGFDSQLVIVVAVWV